MKKLIRISGVIFALLGAASLFIPAGAARADEFCFCSSDLTKKVPAAEDLGDQSRYNRACQQLGAGQVCDTVAAKIKQDNPNLQNFGCAGPITQQECSDKSAGWLKQYQQLYQSRKGGEYNKNLGFVGHFIPPCVLQDTLTENCKDITTLVQLVLNYGLASFGIIGAFALVYFIYGGFILIMSSGNPEKVKKGTDTMLAAVIGLFIAFVAYMLIKFMGDAMGIKDQFRLL